MKDAFGNEIQVGDTVVTAGRAGSSQWLSKHQVVGVKDYKPYSWSLTQEARPVLETQRSHTRRDPLTREKKVTGPYKVHYTYGGSPKAIMVIAKGPDASPPRVTIEDHDLGDLDQKEINPFDPVPGVKW